MAGLEHPADELDIDRIRKWIVRAARKRSIIYELERLTINTCSLFPDLDGLARGLWEPEVLRSADS